MMVKHCDSLPRESVQGSGLGDTQNTTWHGLTLAEPVLSRGLDLMLSSGALSPSLFCNSVDKLK